MKRRGIGACMENPYTDTNRPKGRAYEKCSLWR